MLRKEKKMKPTPENVKEYHRIENTRAEWVEFKEQITLSPTRRTKGDYMLTVVNMLRNQPQLVQELKEQYGSEVDNIEEMWVRLEVVRNENGKIANARPNIQMCTPPVVTNEYTHTLTFFSTDENYLKFIEYDIKKKLEERLKLANLDVSTPVPVEQKQTDLQADNLLSNSIIDKTSEKDSIDIPYFMKNKPMGRYSQNGRRYKPMTDKEWNNSINAFEQQIDRFIKNMNDFFGL